MQDLWDGYLSQQSNPILVSSSSICERHGIVRLDFPKVTSIDFDSEKLYMLCLSAVSSTCDMSEFNTFVLYCCLLCSSWLRCGLSDCSAL